MSTEWAIAGWPCGLPFDESISTADEPVAQRLAQVLEAVLRHEAVAGEAQPEQAEVGFGRHAGLHLPEVVLADVEAAARLLAEAERQRRLGQHRRLHGRLREHRQREVAGEAHAHHADAGAAVALVLLRGPAPCTTRSRGSSCRWPTPRTPWTRTPAPMARIVLPTDGSAPGTPKRCGTTAVQPMAATRSAKSSTFGVMPGISANTSTAGPVPLR